MSFVPPHVPNSVPIGVSNVFPIYVGMFVVNFIILSHILWDMFFMLFPKFPCTQLNPKPSTSVGCVVGPSVNWLSNLFFLPKSFLGSLIEFSMTK